MSKLKLFNYAALFHPTADEEKTGAKSKLIVSPTVILANDEKGAGFQAIRSIPAEYAEKPDQVEVVIRPF